MTGADVLAQLSEWGTVYLHDGRIEAEADTPPPEELRALVDAHRDNLKAELLLMDRPAWLEKLFELYWSGHQTPVRLSNPANGKTEVFMVSVSIKNICAAVAAEIGAPVLEWERLRPEVEGALGSWSGAGKGTV